MMMILPPPPLPLSPTHEARREGGGLAVTVSQSAVLKNYNRASVCSRCFVCFSFKKMGVGHMAQKPHSTSDRRVRKPLGVPQHNTEVSQFSIGFGYLQLWQAHKIRGRSAPCRARNRALGRGLVLGRPAILGEWLLCVTQIISRHSSSFLRPN